MVFPHQRAHGAATGEESGRAKISVSQITP
jgi:hypothetical protein